MPKCREVMTHDPVCCEPGDSITQAAMLMKTEDVGSLPVVDSPADRKLIGIVTDRDLVVNVVAGGSIDGATVRDAMTANPECCREDDEISRAVELMADRQVRRMPVVDEKGRLCGIIAQADVATRVKRDATTGELVEAISEPAAPRR
jgi:CBS domain-containing protein